MSHGYVSESKVKSSMLPGGPIFTDRMDRITLLLVGMLRELLPTLAQVCWGPIFDPEKFLIEFIITYWKCIRIWTKSADSNNLKVDQNYNLARDYVINISERNLVDLPLKFMITGKIAVLIVFWIDRMCTSGRDSKWNSWPKVHLHWTNRYKRINAWIFRTFTIRNLKRFWRWWKNPNFRWWNVQRRWRRFVRFNFLRTKSIEWLVW